MFTENPKNVTTNVTINVTIKLTETEKKILQIITNNPNVTQKEIAEELNVTTMTVKRNIKKLKEKGIIDRVGANKILESSINYKIRSKLTK